MSSMVDAVRIGQPRWSWFIAGILVALLVAGMSIPGLRRSLEVPEPASAVAHQRMAVGLAPYSDSLAKSKAVTQHTERLVAERSIAVPDALAGRKIIHTASLEMVVQHPAEVADRIAAVAENLGGYIVRVEDGGEDSTAATLSVRVPAAKYQEARSKVRELGVRVENERIDSQDVTSQYVDQDANLRNLKAEEAQYLGILKQATTVKDMLAVSEKLSEVHGQIEQQQAEFNALAQETETVAMTIALRSEAEAQVFGLNWRPGYRIKMALRDGLEGIANYATAMAAILFYLPAVLLWSVTILIALGLAFKMVTWIGLRWFGWKATRASA